MIMIMMMIGEVIMMMVRVMMMMIISAITGTLIIRCCSRVRVSISRIVHDCASRERTPRALIDQIIAAAINTVELIRIALLLVIRKTRLAVVVAPFVLRRLIKVVRMLILWIG